ncbi:hypothetical protein KY308_04500 [Candidatus Woesearchaeota archaeon]|nr:hypothetical protein [Candidatus Woesearchaeota archaeon]
MRDIKDCKQGLVILEFFPKLRKYSHMPSLLNPDYRIQAEYSVLALNGILRFKERYPKETANNVAAIANNIVPESRLWDLPAPSKKLQPLDCYLILKSTDAVKKLLQQPDEFFHMFALGEEGTHDQIREVIKTYVQDHDFIFRRVNRDPRTDRRFLDDCVRTLKSGNGCFETAKQLIEKYGGPAEKSYLASTISQ